MNNNPKTNDGLFMPALPPEVGRKLRAMAWRVNSIIVLRGILATLAVALLATLLVMAADATILIVDPRVRWLLTGLAAAATAAAAWHALVLPLRKGRVTPRRMARILETRHPEMQERISSALELLGQGGDAATQGSAQLIDILAKGALSDVRGVKAKSEFAGRTMRPAISAVAVAAVVLGAIFLAWPREGRLLFARAIAPNLSLPSLHAMGLSVEPGDTTCLRGAPLSIRLRAVRDTDDPAEILIARDSSPESKERMQKVSDGVGGAVYEILVPSVDAPFDYRMVCGNGVTRRYSVKIVDPPSLSSCLISVEPPAYTRRQSYSNETGVADIDDIAGSRVSVAATFSSPCDALLMLGGIPLPPLSSGADGASARWAFTLSESSRGEWGVALRDSAGHTNRAERAAIRVKTDAAPEITLSSPAESELRLPPHGKLSLKYSIAEDMGLVATNLNIRREPSGAMVRRPLPLSPISPGLWHGQMDIDFSEMDLAGVGSLRVWLTAMDNLPRELNGPQSATSREVLVRIDQNMQRHEVQKRKQAQEVARASFADAAAKLDAAAARTEALVPRLGDPVATDSAVEELRAGPLREAVKAERELRRVANTVEYLGLPPAAGEALRDAIAEAIHPARQALEEVLLAPDERRAELAESAAKALKDAAETARGFMDRMEAFDKARAKADAIEDLAAKQRKAAAGLERNPRDQAALQAYEQAQRELAQQLPELVDASQESRKDELGAIAGELREKAAELRGEAAGQRKQADIAKRLADESQRDAAAAELKGHADAIRAADAEKAKAAADELSVPTAQIANAAKQAQEAAELAAKAAELQREGATRKAREDFSKAMQMAYAATEAARKAVEDARAAAKRAGRDGVSNASEVADRVEEASAQVEEAARLANEASELAEDAMKKPEAERPPFLEAAAEHARRAAQVARLAAENALLAEKELESVGDTYELLYPEKGSEVLESGTQAAEPGPTPEQMLKGLEDRFGDYAEQARRDVAEAEHAAQALDNGQSYMTSAQDMLWHSMQDARAAMEKLGEANLPDASYRQQAAAEHLEMAAAQMEQIADRMEAANPAPAEQPAADYGGEAPDLSAEDVREIASNMADAEKAVRDMRESFDALSPQERAVAESAVTAEAAAEQASDAAGTAVEAAEQAIEMFDRLGEAQKVEEATANAVEAAQRAGEAAKAVEAAAQAHDTARKAEEARETHDAAVGNVAAAQAIAQSAEQLGELARQIGERVEQALQAQPDEGMAAARQAAELQGATDDAVKSAAESAEASRDAVRSVEATGDSALASATEQTAEAADAMVAVADKTAEAMDLAAKAAEAETPAERIELLQDAAESAAEARGLAQAAVAEARQAREEAARQEEASRQAEAQAAQNVVPAEQAKALDDAAREAVDAVSGAFPSDSDASGLPQSAVDALDMARQAGEFAAKALEQLNGVKGESLDDASNMRLDQALEKSRMAGNLAREAGLMATQSSENAWRQTRDLASAAAQNAAEALEAAKQAEAAADLAAQQARQGGVQPTEEQSEMLAQAKDAAQMAGQAAEQVAQALPAADAGMKTLGDEEKTARRDSAQAAAETAKKAGQLAEAAAKTARALQPDSDDPAEKAARRAVESARDNAGMLSNAAENAARRAFDELAGDMDGQQDPGDQDSESDDPVASSNGEKSSKPGKDSGNKHVEGEEIELELGTFIRGFPASEWARIKGMRGSASLEEILSRVPPDYRELVRRYFLALAEEAAKEEADLQ